MTTPDPYARIRELNEQRTPGPWTFEFRDGGFFVLRPGRYEANADAETDRIDAAYAEEAANVLPRMLADLDESSEKMMAARADWNQAIARLKNRLNGTRAELADVTAERDRLAERVRELEERYEGGLKEAINAATQRQGATE